jgi:hypothetical protein
MIFFITGLSTFANVTGKSCKSWSVLHLPQCITQECLVGKFAEAGRGRQSDENWARICVEMLSPIWRNEGRQPHGWAQETDNDEVKGEIIQNSLIAFADFMASNPPYSTTELHCQDSRRWVQAILGTSERDDQGSNVTLAGMKYTWRAMVLYTKRVFGCQKEEGGNHDNWEFNDPSSRALPIRATDSDLHQCKWMWKELQGIDLESISFCIISVGESHCYRERSKHALQCLRLLVAAK